MAVISKNNLSLFIGRGVSVYQSVFFFFIWRNSPPVGHGLFVHEVSRSHTTTHRSR